MKTKVHYTEVTLYQELKQKHSNVFILMRSWGESYVVLFDDATELLKIAQTDKNIDPELLTDQSESYKRPRVSFGCHYLEKVLPCIVRAGKRVAISDLPETNRPYEEEQQKIIEKAAQHNESTKPKQAQQLYFDFW